MGNRPGDRAESYNWQFLLFESIICLKMGDDFASGIGFMFDAEADKIWRPYTFENVKFELKAMDDNPGAYQSGHYMWPAATTLANIIFSNEKWGLVLDAAGGSVGPLTVVELGAGVGLGGLAAAQRPEVERVVMTDYDPGTLDLIRENVDHNQSVEGVTGADKCSVAFLEWGPGQENGDGEKNRDSGGNIDKCDKEDRLSSSLSPSSSSLTSSSSSSSSSGKVKEVDVPVSELMIGSDLIYAPEVVRPLLATVARLLVPTPARGVFLLVSSFDIGEESNAIFAAACQELGLAVDEVTPLDYASEVHRVQLVYRLEQARG